MFSAKNHEQTILEISQGDYIAITGESFLVDRQSAGLSRYRLRFYREFLRTFIDYCNANSLRFIQEITPDFLRRYFLAFGEKHNPGGVHGAYRTLRAFFQWLVKEEVMAPEWKNPMLKVKAPKVVLVTVCLYKRSERYPQYILQPLGRRQPGVVDCVPPLDVERESE